MKTLTPAVARPVCAPRIQTKHVAGSWPVGTCLDCVALSLTRCAFHADEQARKDREFGAMLRRVVASQHAHEIARVCARFELESDEGGTREEKAERYLARNS